ncbi:ribonuclease P ASCRUDRAFT_84727 [Ascoidea rubescens DSM 1968]|uniref:Uncharacterized protein n=1 Tax=Ascoidea rubescens DSM 1968 TaxID=1344418 RepID=A0A1D2VNH4_9ASCO|nr:hypothetical protein ASCRUDRAFT_84727 [Ascoidea rubescens DSM 1968]ODV63146.1 hypothetical protein ASCRUDRAFT_84727 [Ascoidea rubescens DSM 1968]
MVFKPFANFSRNSSTLRNSSSTIKKTPSFFDSTFHLKNYNQLTNNDLFTSNNIKINNIKVNSTTNNNNKNNYNYNSNYPKHSTNFYNYYSISLDHISRLSLFNQVNNNLLNNNNSNNNQIDELQSSNRSIIDNELLKIKLNNSNNNNLSKYNSSLIHNNFIDNNLLLNDKLNLLPILNNINHISSQLENENDINNNTQMIVDNSFSNNSQLDNSPTISESLFQDKEPNLQQTAQQQNTINHTYNQNNLNTNNNNSKNNRNNHNLINKNILNLNYLNIQKTNNNLFLNKNNSNSASYNNSPQNNNNPLNNAAFLLDDFQLLSIPKEIKFSNSLDKSFHSSLINEINTSIQNSNYLKIYPIYQVIKRNNLPISLDLYNLVLQSLIKRNLTSETIEEKLTNLLNVYTDLISSINNFDLKPNSKTYELVLNGLLSGSLNSFKSSLDIINNNSINIKNNNNIIDNGNDYFKLAIDIFIASNLKHFHYFNQLVYDNLLIGINLFNYKFSSIDQFISFLNILNNANLNSNFVKSEIYYLSLIKYLSTLNNLSQNDLIRLNNILQNIDVDNNNNNDNNNPLNNNIDNNIPYNIQFILNLYNDFKKNSVNNLSLLNHQFEIYSILLNSLIISNQLNLSTKILDSILLSIKQKTLLNLNYTTNLNQNSNTTFNIDEKNFKNLNNVINSYIISLINLNFEKGYQIFAKFLKFNLINIDINDPNNYNNHNDIFLTFLSNLNNKTSNLDVIDNIFLNYINNNNNLLSNFKFFDDTNTNTNTNTISNSSMSNISNLSNFLLHNDNEGKIQLLMSSIFNNITFKNNNSVNNNLSNIISNYLLSILERNKNVIVNEFLTFDYDLENEYLFLSHNSELLIKNLNLNSFIKLIEYMLKNPLVYDFNQILIVLNHYTKFNAKSSSNGIIINESNNNVNNIDPNDILLNLVSNKLFLNQLKLGNKYNFPNFLDSFFFNSCISNFDLQSFYSFIENSNNNSIENNKYFGVLNVFYEYWNHSTFRNMFVNKFNNQVDNINAVANGNASVNANTNFNTNTDLETNKHELFQTFYFHSILIYELFQNLDNYYLEYNINLNFKESLNIIQNSKDCDLSKNEQNFIIQFNFLNNFKILLFDNFNKMLKAYNIKKEEFCKFFQDENVDKLDFATDVINTL